jgi:hypothetical protein
MSTSPVRSAGSATVPRSERPPGHREPHLVGEDRLVDEPRPLDRIRSDQQVDLVPEQRPDAAELEGLPHIDVHPRPVAKIAFHNPEEPVVAGVALHPETWLAAPWSEAKALQRPLPDGGLWIVARGEKEDAPAGEVR